MTCATCSADLGGMTLFDRAGKHFYMCSKCKAVVTKDWADANRALESQLAEAKRAEDTLAGLTDVIRTAQREHLNVFTDDGDLRLVVKELGRASARLRAEIQALEVSDAPAEWYDNRLLGLVTDNNRLRAENAELREDKARLDWLAAGQRALTYLDRTWGDRHNRFCIEQEDEVGHPVGPEYLAPTLREAIDAARESTDAD